MRIDDELIAKVSDVHFGEHQNNPLFLEMQINWFVNELLVQLQELNIRILCILGDLFHNKESTNNLVKKRVYDMFKIQFKDIRIIISLGNHDLYFRDSRAVHSLNDLRDLPNVSLVEEVRAVNIGNTKFAFVPWMIPSEKDNDLAKIGAINPDVVMGHFELAGFAFNKLYPSRHGDDAGLFTKVASNVKKWYSGHYHTQSQRQIGDATFQYLGAPFQYTRIDEGEEKGWWIFNTMTMEDTFVPSISITRFINIQYPFVGTELELANAVRGNIVEIEVSTTDFSTKAFTKFIDKVNALDPYRSEAKLIGGETNAPTTMKSGTEHSETGEVDTTPKNALDLIYDYMDTLALDEDTLLTMREKMTNIYSMASSSELA